MNAKRIRGDSGVGILCGEPFVVFVEGGGQWGMAAGRFLWWILIFPIPEVPRIFVFWGNMALWPGVNCTVLWGGLHSS